MNFDVLLFNILSYLGVDFNSFLNDKNERIKAHKFCYLLNKFFNLPINGSFSLYINGPYNAKLTDVLYDIARNKDSLEQIIINDQVLDVLAKIKSNFPNERANVIALLEIFTTFDFLNLNYPNWTEEQRFEELKKIKQHLFWEEITLDYLKQIESNLLAA